MAPQDLVLAVRRRPFVPFRLHISDGTRYAIRHPELLMLTATSAVVGLPAAAHQPPQVERYEMVDLFHIVRLEPLDAATAPGDGQQGG
jgi:hypothetical protein